MDGVVLREGHLFVIAVDRRGGAKDERLDLHLPGKLQHRLRAGDVEVGAADRVVDGGAHAGLGREVNDGVDRLAVEDAAQKGGVVDVLLVEVEVRAAAEVGDALFFDGAVVVGVEVVDGGDDVALVQKAAAEVAADEAGAAGDEDMHGATVSDEHEDPESETQRERTYASTIQNEQQS